MNKWKRMETDLDALKEQNLYRVLKVIDGPQNAHVSYNGRQMLMLSSNAYLDYCNDEAVKEEGHRILEQYGNGSGGSRLTTGTTDQHILLEKTLAEFTHREAALVFNTGFAANTGIITALCKKGDVIFSDALNHASIIDGCRFSAAEVVIYRHNDMEDLEQKVKQYAGRPGMIVSDGVFSMDGDIVNLPELVRIADTYGLLSMIDEAHALGVIGESGRGCEDYYHMEGSVDICMGTLSKAFGAEGGFVSGPQVLIDYLRNKARSYIFSTSLSPLTAATARKAVELVAADPSRVQQLRKNIAVFCGTLQAHGVPVNSQTAIIPIPVGDEKKALLLAEALMEKGYFISAIRYPTVKRGEAILRATLMSSHTEEEMIGAAETIAALMQQ